MRKLYISPTTNRSCDLPDSLKDFLLSEGCTYRMTCSERQLTEGHPDMPSGMGDSLAFGTEIVRETVRTIDNEDVNYVSWDAPGNRYYIEINDFEEDINNLMLCTGLRLTLDQTDRSLPYREEFLEMVYGLPMIEPGDLIGELETSLTSAQEEEVEEWKKI